jgi:hypothetical protein
MAPANRVLTATASILEFWALIMVMAYALPSARVSAPDPYASVWEATESERRAEACMATGEDETVCIANEMRRSMGVK